MKIFIVFLSIILLFVILSAIASCQSLVVSGVNWKPVDGWISYTCVDTQLVDSNGQEICKKINHHCRQMNKDFQQLQIRSGYTDYLEPLRIKVITCYVRTCPHCQTKETIEWCYRKKYHCKTCDISLEQTNKILLERKYSEH